MIGYLVRPEFIVCGLAYDSIVNILVLHLSQLELICRLGSSISDLYINYFCRLLKHLLKNSNILILIITLWIVMGAFWMVSLMLTVGLTMR